MKICSTSLLVFETNVCPAYKRLEKWSNIPKYVISGTKWKKHRAEYSNEIHKECARHEIDWVFMMFNKLVCGDLLRKYPQRIVNLHPGLLPHFKGLNASEDALRRGARFLGGMFIFL